MAPRKKAEDKETKKPAARRGRKPAAKKPAGRKPAAKKAAEPAEEKAPRKPRKPRKPRAKKAAPAKEAAPKKVEEKEDMFPPGLNLGELLWEYRTRTAEWEKAFAEANLTNYKVVQAKNDPKYKPLLDLMAENDKKRLEIQLAAKRLQLVQARAAEKLGLSLEDFLKNCTVDHETGVVRLLD